jgi:hypothetical protein
MAATYNLGKNLNADPFGVYDELALFFGHLAHLGVALQNFQLKPDGTVIIQVSGAIAPEQATHLDLI